MRRNLILALIITISAVAAGCAARPSTGAVVTPWGAAGVHSFQPQKAIKAPNEAKVNKQVAQLLDDTSGALGDANVRVASR